MLENARTGFKPVDASSSNDKLEILDEAVEDSEMSLTETFVISFSFSPSRNLSLV